VIHLLIKVNSNQNRKRSCLPEHEFPDKEKPFNQPDPQLLTLLSKED
jgi:hypothetical protein